MPDYVQIQNPKTGLYVKIDREIGSIVSHKKTKGPYKNTPIITKTRMEMDMEGKFSKPSDKIPSKEEFVNGVSNFEWQDKEKGDEEAFVEAFRDLEVPVVKSVPTKTFFDFTYPCEHGGSNHCIECYNKARSEK